MRYVEAIIMKFLMVFIALFLVLGLFFGVGLWPIFLVSLAVTVLGFIGDLIVYPRTTNMKASIGDLVLVFVVVWIMLALLIDNPDFSFFWASLFSAILIAVGEWFYHIYLTKRTFGKKTTSHTLEREPRRY